MMNLSSMTLVTVTVSSIFLLLLVSSSVQVIQAFSTTRMQQQWRSVVSTSSSSSSMTTSILRSSDSDSSSESSTNRTPQDIGASDDTIQAARAIYQRTKSAFERFDLNGDGGITGDELDQVLLSLNVETTNDERTALFYHLDVNGDGMIDFQEFVEWYSDAAWEAQSTSDTFRHLLMSRRTVNGFDPNHPVSDEVLKRAIECAIAAPNRSGSEPWRFIKVGPDTVEQLQVLNARVIMAGGDKVISRQQSKPLLPDVWTEIPGWCVVTSLRSPDDPETELKDFRSTSCAMQNFMLSMWSEGVGSKWTEGPTQKTQQFADLVGIDTDTEKVVGILWYGFPKEGGLLLSSPSMKRQQRKGVNDVLNILP
mmetsp:Transcript_5471/g.6292  ORF Transcript_5471/g.6292 Transcript_5471/m.6292 type:complete len:366 (-) Transcript_5471:126-1223(-)